jgi:hypothetical protein
LADAWVSAPDARTSWPRGRSARLLVDIADSAPDLVVLERMVNGEPGLVLQQGGGTMTVIAFDVEDGRITARWAVRNPAEVRSWRPAPAS